MPNTIAISVENLSKAYRIWNTPAARLKSPVLDGVSRLFPSGSRPRRFFSGHSHQCYRDFFALQDVSFQIARGESFGIIGRNGAGKSTLLQIISGTLRPTCGTANVNGRVAALLELGSGFNPDFTGLENVELNGSILGLSRKQTLERMDSILRFADIGRFIKEPVKTYSSGMLVRLAFAVATHVDADLLLIDEALAVGDVFFQQKCYRRLEDLKSRGTSIILVSHSMNAVEQFCSRALLLVHGRTHALGSAVECVKRYYLVNRDAEAEEVPAAAAPKPTPDNARRPEAAGMLDLSGIAQVNDGAARCLRVGVFDGSGKACCRFEQGQLALFYYEFEVLRDIDVPVAGAVLFNSRGVIVHGKNTIEYGTEVPDRAMAGTILHFKHSIRLDLQIDQYTFEIGLASIAARDFKNAPLMTHPDLIACITRHCHLTGLGPFEVTFRKAGQPVQLLHHGIANLDGFVEVSS